MTFSDELGDPTRYRRQLDRLHLRYADTRRLYEIAHDDVALADLVHDKARLAKLIARAVRDGSYHPTPARRYRAKVDKERELCRFALCDFVVHGVVAEVLDEAIAARLSPRLYSFRRGRSSWQALADFAAFVRRHRAERPDPRTRGLYVLRADVRRFCESVPLDAGAPLWRLLREALGLAAETPAWRLVEAVVRPELYDEPDAPLQQIVGMPFGSPVTNVVLNLYLGAVDAALDAVPGAFYARFGDDLVFAHAEAARVAAAYADVERLVRERGLSLSAHKVKRLFFNGAGRPSAEWPDAVGAQELSLLGAEVRFDGTQALPRDKWRALVADVRRRVGRAAALARALPHDERAAALCHVANEALDPESPLAHPLAAIVALRVTSRAQLGELDRHVAVAVAEAVTGVRGARAFRRLPWRVLRERHGLRSVVAMRNRGRRRSSV